MPTTSARTRRAERLANAVVGAFGPAMFGVAAGEIGGLLGVVDHDVRMTWLSGGAMLVLLWARLRRPDADPRVARVLLVLSLPLPLALVSPHSAWLVMWLSGAVLFMWADAIFHLAHVIHPRVGGGVPGWCAASVAAAAGLICLGSFAIVIVNAQMAVVPARLAHRTPLVRESERVVTFWTADGYRLEGTYTPGIEAAGFVLAHGVAGGRDRFDGWAERLGADGFHVFRFDFRAHGLSDGSVVSYGQREPLDVHAAIDTLSAEAGLGLGRIIVVGVSMGGGVVLTASPELASRGTRGIVLLAPTSHYPPLVEARMWFIAPLLPILLETAALPAHAAGHVPMHRYSPRELASSSLPTLVLHGTADRDISPSLTRTLAAGRTNTEVHLLDGVDHSGLTDAVVSDDEAWAVLMDFSRARLSETRTSRW